MRRKAFIRIFWGLLFVLFDITINSVDLILPDFIGYILIVRGLSLLTPEYRSFRKAKVFGIIMIFVSIPSFFEIDANFWETTFLKRQWISVLTGDLSALLPQEVNSAKLLRTKNSRSSIDFNRTYNPQRDKDAVLGEYSDGTVVLILRYASSEDALRALHQKFETDYSFEGIRKRGETDKSFQVEHMSKPNNYIQSSASGFNQRAVSSNVEAGDRVIQQWWNTGWSWWNPADRYAPGGWSNRILYIVEGYRSSADTYKSALEGAQHNQIGIRFNPLFPLSMIGAIMGALLIWEICSGIIGLLLLVENADLMNIAKRRRKFYIILTVTGWAVPVTGFIAPALMSRLFDSSGPAVLGVIVHSLMSIIAVVLVLGLLRRVAKSLRATSLPHR